MKTKTFKVLAAYETTDGDSPEGCFYLATEPFLETFIDMSDCLSDSDFPTVSLCSLYEWLRINCTIEAEYTTLEVKVTIKGHKLKEK